MKKPDTLEEFIDANRNAFDTEEPSITVWRNIQKKPSGRILSLLTFNRVAASILVILSCGAILLSIEKKPANYMGHEKQTPAGKDEFIDTIYQKEVAQMSTLVEIKQIELKQVEKADPDLYKNFITALDQLTVSYNSLKNEFNQNPNKEQLLEAMIQNLKLQQELLSQQLSIFHTIKDKSNDKHSKNI